MCQLLVGKRKFNDNTLLEIEYLVDGKRFVTYVVYKANFNWINDLKARGFSADVLVIGVEEQNDFADMRTYLGGFDREKSLIYHLRTANSVADCWCLMRTLFNESGEVTGKAREYGQEDALFLQYGDGVNLAQKLAIQLEIGLSYKAALYLLAAICLQMTAVCELKVLTVLSDDLCDMLPVNSVDESHADGLYYSNRLAFLGYNIVF